MKVSRVRCDNPNCESVEVPEWETKRSYEPPYGWIRLTAMFKGTGPFLKNVDVCSIECISPAIQLQADEYFEERNR
jgi:hypothetical protein